MIEIDDDHVLFHVMSELDLDAVNKDDFRLPVRHWLTHGVPSLLYRLHGLLLAASRPGMRNSAAPTDDTPNQLHLARPQHGCHALRDVVDPPPRI